MSKKVLIAGGAGFIGSNFIRHTKEVHPDWELIVFDVLTYAGNLENLEGVEYKFINGDIADEKAVEQAFETHKPEYVVNFAAETHVDRSILGPKVFLRTNVEGTQNLLESAKKHKVERYLQISTDEVYGDLGDNSNDFFREDTPLDPNCPYAASKAAADIFVRSYYETYKLPILITRCTNNYGPYQFPEKLIPFFIFRALNNETLPLYGDGKNIRDWLFVRDHARAILSVLERGAIGEVYNIGGHNEKTNIEIAEILLEKLGKSKDLITFIKDRKAHDRRYAMDALKIKKELGWTPEFPFEVWIDETIEWYLSNKKWVENCAKKAEDFYQQNLQNR
ncbi:MAG: dTDP-glucose 4,6-dehydratase [Candidatus Gracilibacteria bacterium]|jgi:dTDP-glucose 4,6-dehydratase|nr:dTDP-glucose 4,6-dehydratase [Candidatus Gracilibacteria bacterium]